MTSSTPHDHHNPQDRPKPESLILLVYEELRRLAATQLARQHEQFHTLQPTALVHEAWIRLTERGRGEWNDRGHFVHAAAMAMRHVLVDRVRRKLARKRCGDEPMALLDFPDAGTFQEDHILLVDECLSELEKTNPLCARVVQLKFFAGLENREAADMLGTSLRSVERHWAYARTRLFTLIQERRADHDTCP